MKKITMKNILYLPKQQCVKLLPVYKGKYFLLLVGPEQKVLISPPEQVLLLPNTCYVPNILFLYKKKFFGKEVWVLYLYTRGLVLYVSINKPHPYLILFYIKKYAINVLVFEQDWVKKRCRNILDKIHSKLNIPFIVNIIKGKPFHPFFHNNGTHHYIYSNNHHRNKHKQQTVLFV